MNRNIFQILSIFLLLIAANSLFATHNRAGEIRVEQIGDCNSLRIKAIVITYTRASSINADRDTLELCWGDGTCTKVARSNGAFGNGEFLGNDIKFNIYIAEHTYPGRATYKITMTDPNRNADILNVNFPNSVNVPFHLATTYTFLNPQFQGCNSTPQLLQPPIDIGCIKQPFQHNPNAYDPDGDSLSYQFAIPFQDIDIPVPRYLFPNNIMPGVDNQLTINSRTGDVLWKSPQRAGEYNLAIYIIEWRGGIPIDTTLRDLQITIEDCDNLPPEVTVPFLEICVVAGELIEFDVIATAPNATIRELTQKVQLQAFGGPLILDISPATFERNNSNFETQPVRKRFRWQTTCEHISEQPYSIVFKATDNFFTADSSGLATLRTVRIKVVGPPPEDVKAESKTGQVFVTWEKPYICEETENEYFRGFSIWRREGSNPFEPDSCSTGLDGRGYRRLAFDQMRLSADGSRYEFVDSDVERGRTYCYRILAEFARTSPLGNFPYNRVRSIPSKEVCIQLSRDIPLITKVSVLRTATADGSIEVEWSKPNATDLDTLQNPPPYRYQLFRADGIDGTNFTAIPSASFISTTFADANDTTFVDLGLNTVQTGYNYKVAFYVNGESQPLGETQPASSVFLTVAPTDKANTLSWQENVPWINTQYVVFLENNGNLTVLDTVTQSQYQHTGLENGQNYCYLIQSIGSYGVDGIVSPIINYSQIACGSPFDNVAPCPPALTVVNICSDVLINFPLTETDNLLNWTNPLNICPEQNDVVGYNIYYAKVEDEPLVQVGATRSPIDTFYLDQLGVTIAGCYQVTAIDDNGNESERSNLVCVDNCPIYLLPNTFTPNGDGANDVFIPYPYRFIESIDLQIFNRWGQLVFETSDANINWTGINLNGENLAEGVYFYTCRVFERRVVGVVPQKELLRGTIHLIRGEE